MSENTMRQGDNKMGTMPIPKLLVSMSLPMMASMLVQAMYNIVDSVFVAQINEQALSAVSMAFPLQSLMIAVSSGTCVGMNALLSRSLGEKNKENARLAAVNGIFLALLGTIVFALIGIFGSRTFYAAQTQTEQIIEYGQEYLTICLVFSFGIFGEFVFERILQSTGRTIYTTISQGVGAITNIIMDPILIFGLFGFPKLGISGAAWATVVGQIIAMLIALYFNIRHNPDVSINMKGFRPHAQTIKNIYIVGLPSIIMQAIGSVTTFGMNLILGMFSDTAITVYGVYYKLQSFIFMPVFGINNAMVPVIAYNYGARNKKRIMDSAKLCICGATAIMFVGMMIFMIFPRQLFMLFDASDHMLEIGIPALRIISSSFIFAGYCIITGSVFQALGNGVYSLITSFARQILCLLPLAYIFAKLIGLTALWFCYPLAEIISLIVTTILFVRIYKQKIKTLG